MKKSTYAQKPVKTVSGKVSFVSEQRSGKNKETGKSWELINVELVNDGEKGADYTQLVFSGDHGRAILEGLRYDAEKNAWVQGRPPIEVGQIVSARGPWELKKWKNADGSSTVKPSVAVLNYSSIKLTVLPPLPWQVKASDTATAPKGKKV